MEPRLGHLLRGLPTPVLEHVGRLGSVLQQKADQLWVERALKRLVERGNRMLAPRAWVEEVGVRALGEQIADRLLVVGLSSVSDRSQETRCQLRPAALRGGALRMETPLALQHRAKDGWVV